MNIKMNESLCDAAKTGDLEKVKSLIKQGANVCYSNSIGWTPLMHAAASNNLEVAKVLIDEGAPFDAVSNLNQLAKDIARDSHSLSVFGFLQNEENHTSRSILETPILYNKETKKGMLTDSKVKCYFDVTNDVQLEYVMRINHKCALNFLAGDKSLLVFERPYQNLESYLLEHKVDPSLEAYEIKAMYEHKSVSNPYVYHFVPEFYRALFADMIDFVLYLHSVDLSINGMIDIANHVFVLNKYTCIKFFGLDYQPLTARHAKNDLYKLAKVIQKIVIMKRPPNLLEVEVQSRLPVDFTNLLVEMQSFRNDNKELIANHIALLPVKERLARINNFTGRVGYLSAIKKRQYFQVKNKMTRYSTEDWTTIFMSEDHRLGAAKDCFSFGNMTAAYIGTGRNDLVNESLLRYCRNMVEHLSDHLYKHMSSTPSLKDTECTIMYFFGFELTSFQEVANSCLLLPEFL